LERTQKEQVVAELAEKFARAKSLTFTEYKGLSVAHANQLRRECRKAGIEYLVAKNTLIHLALPESVRERVKPFLVNTTSVALDFEDGVLGPKTLANFAKSHEAVKLKAGILDGEVLDRVPFEGRHGEEHDLVARLALEGREALLEARLVFGGEHVREVVHATPQRRDLEGERRARDEEPERESLRRGQDQNFTSGGFSLPGCASKVGRTSIPSRKRAVRFVGKKRTSLLYSATVSM